MTTSKLTQAIELDKPLFVLKLGGSMLKEVSDSFIQSVIELRKNHYVLFVHGGGPEINGMLEKLKIPSVFVNGQRKTTEPVLEIVEMVLGGKMNQLLSGKLKAHGIQTVGLSGHDIITASYLDHDSLGFVGKVEKVDDCLLRTLLKDGYVPVIAPLGKTKDGQTVNINADVCAAAVAEALKAERLLFVTDVPGILKDGELLEEATPSLIDDLIQEGTIYGGMIPKVTSAISALSDQLKEAMIVNGKGTIFHSGQFVGTKIKQQAFVSGSNQ